MEWSTHMLSGVLAGYVITGGDWRGALVGGVAGIIPDLDEPKSKFGKMLLPISIPINKTFGHRTFTHSLLFALLISSIFMFLFEVWIGLAILGGVLSHIGGDMLTGKVKFLYPSKKSIGITIKPKNFKLIDKFFRTIMIVGVFFMMLHMLPDSI